MKSILILFIFCSVYLLADTKVRVIKVVQYSWSISCQNGVDYYTIFQVIGTGQVFKSSCSILGTPGMVLNLPDGYKAELM